MMGDHFVPLSITVIGQHDIKIGNCHHVQILHQQQGNSHSQKTVHTRRQSNTDGNFIYRYLFYI